MIERWKEVEFKIPEAKGTVLKISSTGRMKIFNKSAPQGRITKGALINGYNILRLKFFRPRPPEVAEKVKALRRDLEAEAPGRKADWLKKQLHAICREDLKDRVIHWHSLAHRMVAEYFLQKPSPKHTVVGHKNYDKLDNRMYNLVWQTPEESYRHQQLNPLREKPPVNAKLTETKVMYIKKLLKEGKKTGALAKSFKVSPAQISRIKKEENWKTVQTA